MGIKEFWAWVDQVWQESEQERRRNDTWAEADSSPNWQYLRQRREKARGR